MHVLPIGRVMTAVALRVVGFLVLIAIARAFGMYLITKDRRWLTLRLAGLQVRC